MSSLDGANVSHTLEEAKCPRAGPDYLHEADQLATPSQPPVEVTDKGHALAEESRREEARRVLEETSSRHS